MKILSISSDRNLFNEKSEVRQRIIEYGRLADELHIIVFSRQKSEIGTNSKLQILNSNIFLYPTNSCSRWFYVFDAVKISKKILAADDEWLVSVQDPFESGLAGWLIKRKFKIPLQIQIHTDFLSPYFLKESFLNKIRVLLAWFLISRADCIRVVSERIKKSLLSTFHILPSKISILPIYVYVKKIREAPVNVDLRKKYPQFNFTILMASRLTREKNIGLAIETMEEIVKKHPKTGLIIVGSGPERNNLKSQISNLKINENIIIEDWSDDLISYYKTADLFLLTSNYEGYGMSVVEAMAAGCPVIMTDVGCAGEVIINNQSGLVVEPGNYEQIEIAIQTLIKDEILRKKISEGAIQAVKKLPGKGEIFNLYKKSWETAMGNKK